MLSHLRPLSAVLLKPTLIHWVCFSVHLRKRKRSSTCTGKPFPLSLAKPLSSANKYPYLHVHRAAELGAAAWGIEICSPLYLQKDKPQRFPFAKVVLGASSALSAGSGGVRAPSCDPTGPVPPGPDFPMLRRQQVINLDILHFFISSYLTFNEILPLTKVPLKLNLKQGQTGVEIFWGWVERRTTARDWGMRKRELRQGSAWP